jgi:D-alanyl-D-alanine carboxypeptidase (penicillin-binding protein 5/6)
MRHGLTLIRTQILTALAAATVTCAVLLSATEPSAQQRQNNDRPQSQPQRGAPPAPQRQQAPPARPTARPNAVLPSAQTLDTLARQAIIVDMQTGAVLYEKNADDRMAPSSMSKLLTVYIVLQRIREGRLRLSDELPVSERAQRMGGSKMFVQAGTTIRVEDLLRGVIVQSGNDACVVFAEGLASSEEAFADLLNETARRIGLTASQFRNSSGWPEPEHYSTARDLAVLARRLIEDFPEYYTLHAERAFVYNGIRQENRNPLLGRFQGADGIKTGHTEAGGYGLAASALRGGRRIVMIVNGLQSMRARAEEAERLMDWAFREYENVTLFRAGSEIDRAGVWMGAEPRIPMITQRDIIVSVPRRARAQMRVTANFEQPVRAPIARGQEIGRLTVSAPGIEPTSHPLVAATDVDRLGLVGRMTTSVGHLLWGGSRQPSQ